MDTLDLLTQLYAAGVTVTIHEGDALQLRGQPCPPHLKAQLVAHKPAILATLRAHRIGEPDPHPAIHAVRGYVVPCRNLACPVLGPCAWQLAGQPCPLTEPNSLEDAA